MRGWGGAPSRTGLTPKQEAQDRAWDQVEIIGRLDGHAHRHTGEAVPYQTATLTLQSGGPGLEPGTGTPRMSERRRLARQPMTRRINEEVARR